MSTTPNSPKRRALELKLSARYQDLTPEDQRLVEATFRDHPEIAADAAADQEFLEVFEQARVEPSAAGQQRLEQRICELSLRRRSRERRSLQRASPWSRFRDVLLGPGSGQGARGSLMLSRCVAVYLGIAAGILPWYFLAGETKASYEGVGRELALELIPAAAAERSGPRMERIEPTSRPR